MPTPDELWRDAEAFCMTMTEAQDAFAHELLATVAAKWPLWVMHVLADAERPLRFARVHERIEGVSQKVLTQTLRKLEKNGLVSRTLYAEIPPRVEYALTPLGHDLLLRLVPLWRWIGAHVAEFETARAKSAKAVPADEEDVQ